MCDDPQGAQLELNHIYALSCLFVWTYQPAIYLARCYSFISHTISSLYAAINTPHIKN